MLYYANLKNAREKRELSIILGQNVILWILPGQPSCDQTYLGKAIAFFIL